LTETNFYTIAKADKIWNKINPYLLLILPRRPAILILVNTPANENIERLILELTSKK